MRTTSISLTVIVFLLSHTSAHAQMQKGKNQFSAGAAATWTGDYRLEATYERALKKNLGLELTASAEGFYANIETPPAGQTPGAYGYSQTTRSYTYVLFDFSFFDKGYQKASFNRRALGISSGLKWYSREQTLRRKGNHTSTLQVVGGFQAGFFSGSRDVWVQQIERRTESAGFLTVRNTETRMVNYYSQKIGGARLNGMIGMRINFSPLVFMEFRKSHGLRGILYVSDAASRNAKMNYGLDNAWMAEPGYALKFGIRF